MRNMSTPYELTGRTNQKARTRHALVAATRELLAEGVTGTVEQAADRAGVSRTTAYRYFANQRALLQATYPELEAPSLVDIDSTDPVERVERVVDALCRQIAAHEPELRAQLRLALEPGALAEDLPLRQGRAITWYEDALEPLRARMGAAEVRRLAQALRSAAGLESYVWLVDVARQTPDQAGATMCWSARALVRAAIDDLS